MELAATGAEIVHVPLTSTLYDGTEATVTAVDFGFAQRGGPDRSTAWVEGDVTDGDASILVVGPEVDPVPAGAIVCPSPRRRLYVRDSDNPETVIAYVDTVEIGV